MIYASCVVVVTCPLCVRAQLPADTRRWAQQGIRIQGGFDMAGPQFVKYFAPVLQAMKELGNSARPAEVREWIADRLDLTDDDLNETTSSGGSRFENQVAWARFYLSRAGYLDASRRGVWSLTEKGLNTSVTDNDALAIFRATHEQFKTSTAEEEGDFTEATSLENSTPPETTASI